MQIAELSRIDYVNICFDLGGVWPAVLTVSPYNYSVRMRSDGGAYVRNVREYRNFMASRLLLYLMVLSGFILLPNLNHQFLLIMVITVLLK